MELSSYMDVLKFAIQMQVTELEKEMEDKPPLASLDYLEGVHRGLEIALEKIEASRFLAER